MKPQNRRQFFIQLSGLAALTGLASRSVFAQELLESDPVATALCYRVDISKVDKKDPKCSRFAPGQNCGNCQLYTGAAGSSIGPCTLFQNKLVPAKAWCNGWVKKAG